MGVKDLLQWWNLIYVAPLLISLVWIVATVFSGVEGGMSHGGHDIDHDVGDVGHDHDFHHEGGHDAHNAAHVVGHGHESHADNDLFTRVLTVLGVGQVPLALLIGIFMLCWGAFGMVANHIFGGILKYPAIYIWPSMGITFFVSSVITRAMAAVVGRALPSMETYGISRAQLGGSLGKAVHTVSDKAGTVDIKDTYGTVHRVQAKTESDEENIPAGREVIVVEFDEEDKRFIVKMSTL